MRATNKPIWRAPTSRRLSTRARAQSATRAARVACRSRSDPPRPLDAAAGSGCPHRLLSGCFCVPPSYTALAQRAEAGGASINSGWGVLLCLRGYAVRVSGACTARTRGECRLYQQRLGRRPARA
eukprot:4539351-Prymnesium_polylepis.1